MKYSENAVLLRAGEGNAAVLEPEASPPVNKVYIENTGLLARRNLDFFIYARVPI